ncbi:cytochrome P450 [Hysterangium stoloniferum]|nr:cytochrome P450 [Hysterangium stoloniferum]
MFSLYTATATVLLLIALLAVSAIFRYLRSTSIAHLPGPKPESWLVGSLRALMNPEEVGDADFAWSKEFGSTIAIKGVMGRDILWTADPKAMQHILNISGYKFHKPQEVRAISSLTTGHGLIWAEGAQHIRHRKIMLPAFSFGALRAFLPVFTHIAQRMVNKLRDNLSESGEASSVVDILPWLAHTTLDAIGEVGFGYQFGALDQGSKSKLAQAYDNLFSKAFGKRPDSMIVMDAVMGWVPQWMVSFFLSLPFARLEILHKYNKVALGVAKEVVDGQTAIYASGKEGSKDIMSVLVRANLAEEPEFKLSDKEVMSQLTTLFLAGHETTASTLTWTVYELARHPEYQKLVKDEIKATREQASRRGDKELSVADLDSMKYLLAIMKETLRFHPIIPALHRVAGEDDVIPLSTPATGKTGETITSVRVGEGQRIIMSLVAYNRLEALWGNDPHVWRPERFLDGSVKQGANMGVFANLASFSSGVRSCIGWRFAVVEMQAILVETLESFEFSPPPEHIRIMRTSAGIVKPMVKEATDGRARLPVTIKAIQN